MRACRKCGIEYSGSLARCKPCLNEGSRARYYATKEKRKISQAAYYVQNREKILEAQHLYYKNNTEARAFYTRNYKLANPAKQNALAAKRRATKLQATPSWINKNVVDAIYKEAHRLGKHVDHIIPLSSLTVCGLHWEGNLQLLDPIENMRKSNHY